MSYNPYDKPTTLGQQLYQVHLGQMGYNTGAGAANSVGFELRRVEEQKRREREKLDRVRRAAEKPWWK